MDGRAGAPEEEQSMGKRIAIVTGASSGLGREYARLLVQEPAIDEVWAIARHEDKLSRLRAELGGKVAVLPLDLSGVQALTELRARLAREAPQVRYLINNAGYAKLCASREFSPEEALDMIGLNCGGTVAMGLICLAYMGPGSRMLNVASQAAFQPLPYLNLYSATKAFVRNYSRALGVELRRQGVTVTCVCPGWMDTQLFERAEVGARLAPHNFAGMVSPAPVARKSLEDARRGRALSVYGAHVKLGHLAAKLLPQRAMMWLWLRQQGL